MPTPTAGATPSNKTVGVGNGEINGTDNQILTSAPNTHGNNGEGDLMSGDPGALPQGGGQGQTVDGIPSATSMSHNYHVHAYLGLIVNGQQIAIPDAIGMINPVGDSPSSNPCTGGAPNFECYADGYYYIHTHDPSGAIHLEAPSPICGKASNYATPCNMSLFTLGNVFDVWGISISPSNFGPFNGPVSIYTSPLQFVSCGSANPCYTPSTAYSLYTGDPTAIPLYSHTVVWIVVGTPPDRASSLPNVEWFLGT